MLTFIIFILEKKESLFSLPFYQVFFFFLSSFLDYAKPEVKPIVHRRFPRGKGRLSNLQQLTKAFGIFPDGRTKLIKAKHFTQALKLFIVMDYHYAPACKHFFCAVQMQESWKCMHIMNGTTTITGHSPAK